MRRSFAFVLRILAAAAAGLAILVGFAAWELSRGPISLDPLAPYIAGILATDNDVSVTIDHTLLSFDESNRIAILARGVHLQRSAGGTLTLDELALEFGLRPLLSGVVAPTRIALRRPDLQLVRETDGSFHLGIGAAATPEAEDWGARLVRELLHQTGGRGWTSFLTQLSIEQARLSLDDRSLGVIWQADTVDLDLKRSAEESSGQVAIGAGAARLSGDYIYTPADNNLVVRLGFAELRPARWAQAVPALAALAAIDVPVSGQVIAVIDGAQLTLRDATWDVSLGPGSLHHPAVAGGSLALRGARMQAGYDPVKGDLNIGLLTVDLVHGAVGVTGVVSGIGSTALLGSVPQALDLQLDLAADGINVDDFPLLWPETVASGARPWVVANLHDGTIARLHAQLAAHLDLGAASPSADIRQLSGGFDFTGLTVDYFHPLPPARNVAGSARFDATKIEFSATSGEAGGVTVSGATAGFYGLDTRQQDARIHVSAAGAFADALAILDTPPLYYARAIGIDPKRTTGKVATELDLTFPLVGDLQLSQIAYSATATLGSVSVRNALLGRDLGDGDLHLELNRSAAEVSGAATLAGVPVKLVWHESFDPKATIRQRYEIEATLDDAQRRSLGLDVFDGYVQGRVGVQASYSLGQGKEAAVVARLDLADSALAIEPLGWSKPPGAAASAQLMLDLADDRVTRIRDARLSGSGIDLAASATFAPTRTEIAITHLAAGATDLHGEAVIEKGEGDKSGAWSLALSGKSLDATALMKSLNRPGDSEGPPFKIEAELDRIILGPKREASQVAANLVSNGPHWQSVSLNARLGAKASLALNYGSDKRFKLTSDDLGAVLRLADIYDQVQGGTLTLSGEAEDRNGQRILALDAQGADYRVVGAPALARLLSLASLSGIGALLNGEGIPFSTLSGRVTFAGDLVSLQNMRAYGGALGINASGNVERAKGVIDVAGTLVPAYTLNSVLGSIPLLGNLLVGGAGEGVFAANFRIYGPSADPKVSVNPLSTLAPGVLRRLFLFSPGGPADDVTGAPN